MQQTPRVTVTTECNVAVGEIVDRKILDEVSIAELGDQLNALAAESDSPRIVLDFAGVSHMSSSALGMLITLHKRVREKDGQLRLCNIKPDIHEVFVITRLNEIFHMCRSRAEAIESLS